VTSIARNVRERDDACPGALALHPAADGALARVRLPGGAISGQQLSTVADLATELGDGCLELTSRGNLQLRGLPDGAAIELGNRLTAAGLLPSMTHERVRNILASPLSGIDGFGADVSGLVGRLDRELCARPELAGLPGRFLFGLDDGRGDVAPLGADVLLVAKGDSVSVGPIDVALEDAVATMLALAEAFLHVRADQQSRAWRIAELAGGMAVVADRARRSVPHIRLVTRPRADLAPADAGPASGDAGRASGDAGPAPAEPVGIVGQPDGRDALVVLAPLGRLDPTQLGFLAAHAGPRGLRITPWRSVVIRDLADGAAIASAADRLGFGVASSSPWYRVSACTGRPGCAEALADVRADALDEARDAATAWPGRRVRWSGCDRRCGRPRGTDVDVVATPAGYRISEARNE
jgi:precorrin-3B synthase